ncbi:hypothetical protein [Mesobacillus maritimus]|uniref:hypothetical protein n=1 Tax=Mesobacillus maritimus TaxID=1643336 RepID=UPI00384FCABB
MMPRTGRYFNVTLKSAHLNWGTEGNSRIVRKRNPFEVYLPISIENARDFNIKTGEVFACSSSDGFFDGPLKATGTQGPSKEFAKNFYKDGDMRALGYWLKDRMEAKVGDKIRIEFTDEDAIRLTYLG